MQALPLPPDGDQNRAPQLLALFWAPFPITAVLVSTRLFVRLRLKNLGWDDYLMFIAWVTQLCLLQCQRLELSPDRYFIRLPSPYQPYTYLRVVRVTFSTSAQINCQPF